MNLPFDTSDNPLGIDTLICMLSTSSRHWSLFGHHTLAPVSSQAVLIQGLPAGSLRKVMAPNLPGLHRMARIVEVDAYTPGPI